MLKKIKLYGDSQCTLQPSPQPLAGGLGDVAGKKCNGKFMCQGGKTGTGKLDHCVWLHP